MNNFNPVPNSTEVGARLLKPDFEKSIFQSPSDDFFQQKNIIILIHGFTANCLYLIELGEFLEKNGFKCLFFNYNSYAGISTASETLLSFLNNFFKRLDKNFLPKNIILVAHSMGGLVARAAISRDQFFFKALVMLGTPNAGTLHGSLQVDFLLDIGEFLSGPLPKARISCQSSRELTMTDGPNLSETFIGNLNEEWSKDKLIQFPTLTISGAKNEILISKNGILNYAVNEKLQRIFDNCENDGLVPENSVILWGHDRFNPKYNHLNYYPEYRETNHTNLINNHDIFMRITSWLKFQC